MNKTDSPLFRQWSLVRALCARHFGVSVQDLAQELRVTEKTIRRDLQTFARVGFPLDETLGPHGKKLWRIRPNGTEPQLSFAFDETLSLYLGRRFLDPLAGTILWEAAQKAFQKIHAGFGKGALNYLDKLAGQLHLTTVGASDYSAKREIVDELLRAVEERKATHIEYQSTRSTEPVTYEVFPYGLIFHRGSMYLVAHSRNHEEVRHFKIDRVSQVDVSAFPFTMPAGFDLSKHLSGCFGVFQGREEVLVKVQFSAGVARFVEEGQWHASQKLRRQKNGMVIAEFRLSSTEEIKRWIMSFGSQAVVLEPEGLRQEMWNEFSELIRQYDPTQKPRTKVPK